MVCHSGTAGYPPTSSAPLLVTTRGVAASSFQPATTYATGHGAQALVQADFNNDGRQDLAVVNVSDDTVSILIGNGNGTFQPKVDYRTDAQPQSIVAGDLNGDGIIDLAIVSGDTYSVSVPLGNGDGTFQRAVIYETLVSYGPSDVRPRWRPGNSAARPSDRRQW